MEWINFEFYVIENSNFNKYLKELFKLKKLINNKKIFFGKRYRLDENKYTDELLEKILSLNLTEYEDYLLELRGDNDEFIILNLSPYLKEVAIVKFSFKKSNYEKNKEYILKNIDNCFTSGDIMIGFGERSIYNPYCEQGYGNVKFGAHWLMWFGNWALQYINKERIKIIKENTIDMRTTNRYVRAMLAESPWEYTDESFEKNNANL